MLFLVVCTQYHSCAIWRSLTPTVMLALRNTIMRRFKTSTSPIVLVARGSCKSPGKVFHSPRKVFGSPRKVFDSPRKVFDRKRHLPFLLWSSYGQEKHFWTLYKSTSPFKQVWNPPSRMPMTIWIFPVKLVLHHQMTTQMIWITSCQLGHIIPIQKIQILKPRSGKMSSGRSII